MNWEVKYLNYVGFGEDLFKEWWLVTNGIKEFTCKSKEHAEWLKENLNFLSGLRR
jgi:hypothetical protein